MNLPRVSGLWILKQIKDDPNLQKTPVIVISNPNLKKEAMGERYNLVGNSVLRKWVSMKDFASIVKAIEDVLGDPQAQWNVS